MSVTIAADFDPGFGTDLVLLLYIPQSDTLGYTLPLTERINDIGSYVYTGEVVANRYRTALVLDGEVVQRGRIAVGTQQDTEYHVGNWEGSIDIGYGAYYLAGTGAYIVQIFIHDDQDQPVPNAIVSLYSGGFQRHGRTDENGLVQFNSDARIWAVSILATGLNFGPETLNVAGNTTEVYNGTPFAADLPELGDYQVHVQGYTFDEYSQLEDGVEVNTQMISPSNLAAVFDDKVATYTSVDGIVILENLFQGAVYNIWRKNSKPIRFRVPVVSSGVTAINMPPLIGNDEDDPCL